ncbi:MAG TPA: response regulator [Xanthobacteraceae bacterium]|nr:response regulator [Xanthobacteraceae bacterium]
MSIPLREAEKSDAVERPAATVNGAPIELNNNGQTRVLLVEDEALVGIMIQECLSEFGCQITGPVCSASDALAAAKDGHFDAAILDINLGDGLVYQVAEVLSQRGVPFIFVTGYDSHSVDSRFSEVPILQKPIERQVLQKMFVEGRRAAMA